MIASLLSHNVKFLTGMSGKYEETHPVGGKTSLRRVTCRRELTFFLPLFFAVLAISMGIHLPNMEWYGEIASAVQEANRTIEDVKKLQFFNIPFLFEVRGHSGTSFFPYANSFCFFLLFCSFNLVSSYVYRKGNYMSYGPNWEKFLYIFHRLVVCVIM